MLVEAHSTLTANAEAYGGAAGSILGLSYMQPMAAVDGVTRASLEGAVSVSGTSLNVKSTGTHTANADSFNIAIGLISGVGTYATARVGRTTEAKIAAGASVSLTGPITVESTATNHATANTPGFSVGGISIAAMLPSARISGATAARIDGTVTSSTSVTVQTRAENVASATAFVAGIGVGQATIVIADAQITNSADVSAVIGSTASITTTGAVMVDAQLTGLKNKAKADVTGVSGGLAASISVILATAKVAGEVAAALNGSVSGATSVTVQAIGRNLADADVLTVGVSLGATLSAAAVNAEIVGDSGLVAGANVTASVGSTASISTSGAITVTATGDNDANADTDVGSGGLAAGGVSLPTAKVGGATRITFDGDVTNANGVTLTASSDNDAVANALVVAIGGLAGAGDLRAGRSDEHGRCRGARRLHRLAERPGRRGLGERDRHELRQGEGDERQRLGARHRRPRADRQRGRRRQGELRRRPARHRDRRV